MHGEADLGVCPVEAVVMVVLSLWLLLKHDSLDLC